jgi:starvation-inducible DNA-binding protein
MKNPNWHYTRAFKNSIAILSSILANEMIIRKIKKISLNVCGESFMEFHKLFEAQYTELEASIDKLLNA